MITIDVEMVRRLRGLTTQTALARKAGIARATVNRIEQGHAESVTFGTVNRLADALGVDADKIIAFVEPPKKRRK